MNPVELRESFCSALESSAASIDNVSTRKCSGERHDGVEYTFYGEFVPIRPIIDEMSEVDGHAISSMCHVDEGDPRLIVFVADLPEQEHPAFTGAGY